jgi:predicted nucleotide-binding protein
VRLAINLKGKKMLAKIIQDGLRKHGFHILETKQIQHGTQIRLLEGAVINVYRTPKILVQGKSIFESPEKLKEQLEYVLPARITVWTLA